MVCGCAHTVFSCIFKICMEFIDVNVLCCLLFGCHLFLFFGRSPLLHVCLPFQLLIPWLQNSGVVWTILEIGSQKNPSSPLFVIFSSKRISVQFVLSIRAFPSDITWKLLWSARVTLSKFSFRPGITSISDNVTQ